jgi:hypothetical protein
LKWVYGIVAWRAVSKFRDVAVGAARFEIEAKIGLVFLVVTEGRRILLSDGPRHSLLF